MRLPGRDPRPLESEVLRSVLAWLSGVGVFCWRANSGRLRVQRGGREHLYAFAGVKGLSDVVAVLPDGRFGAIEVKRPGESLTDDQADFLDRVNRQGALGVVVSSVQALEQALRAEGYRVVQGRLTLAEEV